MIRSLFKISSELLRIRNPILKVSKTLPKLSSTSATTSTDSSTRRRRRSKLSKLKCQENLPKSPKVLLKNEKVTSTAGVDLSKQLELISPHFPDGLLPLLPQLHKLKSCEIKIVTRTFYLRFDNESWVGIVWCGEKHFSFSSPLFRFPMSKFLVGDEVELEQIKEKKCLL